MKQSGVWVRRSVDVRVARRNESSQPVEESHSAEYREIVGAKSDGLRKEIESLRYRLCQGA